MVFGWVFGSHHPGVLQGPTSGGSEHEPDLINNMAIQYGIWRWSCQDVIRSISSKLAHISMYLGGLVSQELVRQGHGSAR